MLRSIHIGLCALLAAASGCTESYKPDVSTETGNPPAIDSTKIALVVTSDEVHIRGAAGAVTPPEGEVEVTVVRSGDVTSGDVEGDGSFDVMVDAEVYDVFEVRAVNGGERSAAVTVVRGGAQVGEGEGGELTCMQKTDIARDTVEAAIEGADKSCVRDEDCMLASPDSQCFLGCGYTYLSAGGLASVRAIVGALDEGLCNGFDQAECDVFAPPCLPPDPGVCLDGQCVADGPSGGCMDCLERDLEWRATGAGILPALPSRAVMTVSGCATYERTDEQGESCTSEVYQCNNFSSQVSTFRLRNALEDEEVIAAFMAGGTHGVPEEQAGYTYEVTVDGRTITYRTCAGPQAGVERCEDEGSALAGFVGLLELLEQQQPCESMVPVEPEADCTSDFDTGPCLAFIRVYWHDSASGACLPSVYGGCGGNGNRYESQQACEAACPPPTSTDDCPEGRRLIEECFECGLAGGCSKTGNYCALECSNDDECNEEAGPLGFGSQCDEAQGVCVAFAGCI